MNSTTELSDLELEQVAGGAEKALLALPILWPILFPARVRAARAARTLAQHQSQGDER